MPDGAEGGPSGESEAYAARLGGEGVGAADPAGRVRVTETVKGAGEFHVRDVVGSVAGGGGGRVVGGNVGVPAAHRDP